MSDVAAKAELLRSLRRLVRGLSALFWGLPLALFVCVRASLSEWLRPLGLLPPVISTVLLLYGLSQLGHFQPQERVWTHSLDRAKILAIINIGLSPFVFWWNHLPQVSFYYLGLGTLMLSGLLFLFNLNFVLQRLAAMLPDETLRLETRLFTSFNLYLLFSIVALVAIYLVLVQIDPVPGVVMQFVRRLGSGREWVLTPLIMLPLAMTMTLIWKIKEVVLASVFEGTA